MVKKFRDEAGFSMLELIIYISIVGIILAVAVPKYNNAIVMANTARIQADLQTLDGAVMMYYTETGQYPGTIGDLDDYVKNVTELHPPKGKYMLKDGTWRKMRPSVMVTDWRILDGRRNRDVVRNNGLF